MLLLIVIGNFVLLYMYILGQRVHTLNYRDLLNKCKYHNVGEFGVVYKAHLLTDQDVGFTAVAVKTLKGTKIAIIML